MYIARQSRLKKLILVSLITIGVIHTAVGPLSVSAEDRTEKILIAIPPNHDDDIKLYLADGKIVSGIDALARMDTEAGLVLWLAGNQFFAMDEVVKTFEGEQPGVSVGVITLPPGLLLSAIQAGGWTYGDKDFPSRPDVY